MDRPRRPVTKIWIHLVHWLVLWRFQNSAQGSELGRDRKSAMGKRRGSCLFASHLTKAEPKTLRYRIPPRRPPE